MEIHKQTKNRLRETDLQHAPQSIFVACCHFLDLKAVLLFCGHLRMTEQAVNTMVTYHLSPYEVGKCVSIQLPFLTDMEKH